MAEHNEIGVLGEEIAVRFLENKGFRIISRNYLQKNGEIDIIAFFDKKTHFIEVKTASINFSNVSRENMPLPEENVTREKLRRLGNVIEGYIAHHHIKEWIFDICTVFVDRETKKAKVRFLENELLPE